VEYPHVAEAVIEAALGLDAFRARSLTLLLTKEMTMKVKTNVKAGVAAYYYYRVVL
jgi:hypothetical protein